MKKIAALAFALLSVLVVLFFMREDRSPQLEPLGPQHVQEADPAASLAPLEDSGEERRDTAGVIAAEESDAKAEAAVESDLQAIVFGQVVDAAGDAISGARVRLQSHKVWTEGVDVPLLGLKRPIVGFEMLTSASGEFRFEVPVPTVATTWLDIEPDRFHDSYQVRFNSNFKGYEPSLTAGTRDLGVIQLSTTGAILGRVLSSRGEPLPGAKMSIGTERSNTFGRNTYSEADGSYVLGHAPIGTYLIESSLEGYLSAFIEPVTVEARRDTVVVDFILKEAPTLVGRVTDENGLPLENVRLWGWPQSSGQGAGARSGADGRFTVYLPQDEPYSLEGKLAGHEKWGGARDVLFEPGTADIEIVMQSVPLTRFVVVDADTNQTLNEFGVSILLDNGSRSTQRVGTEHRRPKAVPHPEGFAEVTAREGVDLYLVAAPGYALRSGDVAYDEPGVPTQTVRLKKSASIIGRLLRGDQPVVGAAVEVVSGGAFLGSAYIDRNSLVRSTTDHLGRFKLAGMSAREYRFTATPTTGAPLKLDGLRLNLGREMDLGDLQLPKGATIEGELLVPAGIDPSGIEVALGPWHDKRITLVDNQGQFRFEDLAPGNQTLTAGGRPGVLGSGPSVEINCVEGETHLVTIDARDRALSEIVLTFDFGDLSVEDLNVQLVDAADPIQSVRLGKCDANSQAHGAIPGWNEAWIELWLPDDRTLLIKDTDIVPRPQERIEKTIKREFASLRISLPEIAGLPADGDFLIELTPTISEEEDTAQVTLVMRDSLLINASGWSGGTAREIFIAGLPAGPHRVSVEFNSPNESVATLFEVEATSIEPSPLFQAEAQVTLALGKEAAVALN